MDFEEILDNTGFCIKLLHAQSVLLDSIEITNDMNKLVRNNFYIENVFFTPKVPIETHNLLNCIYKSTSLQYYKEATHLKISYMATENEAKKNKNAVLLNIIVFG